MAEIKREYVIPLRRKSRTAPKWRRSKKAISVLKDFIRKHMKTDDVIICSELNEKIWEKGIRNPPGKVSVIALKKSFAGKEKVLVNLAEFGIDEQVKLYEQAMPQQAQEKTQAPEEENKESQKTEVKEAEVKEVEKPQKEEKAEEKKTPAKAQKEEKKNE